MNVRLGQQATRDFHPRDWSEIRRFFADMADQDGRFTYMIEVVESVVSSGLNESLGATTSMHDLIVAALPLMEPPFDVIAVRAPGSLGKQSSGEVLVEHLTPTGHDERITRPVADAVPLFWRFVAEKFGIEPPATR